MQNVLVVNYTEFCSLLLCKSLRWYCSQLSKARQRNIYLILLLSANSLVLINISATFGSSCPTQHWDKDTGPLAFFAVPWTALSAAQCKMLTHPSPYNRKKFYPSLGHFTRSNTYSVCFQRELRDVNSTAYHINPNQDEHHANLCPRNMLRFVFVPSVKALIQHTVHC